MPRPKPKLWSSELSYDQKLDRWRETVGDTYDIDGKKEGIRRMIDGVRDSIGLNILDVGSGTHPISSLIDDHGLPQERRIVTIDVACPNHTRGRVTHVNADIQCVLDQKSDAFKDALCRVRSGFELSGACDNPAQVDTMFFSEILNYVDFASVLTEFERFLRPGGQMLIVNTPNRGWTGLFHAFGAHSSGEEILEKLGELGLTSNVEVHKLLYTHHEKSMFFITAKKPHLADGLSQE